MAMPPPAHAEDRRVRRLAHALAAHAPRLAREPADVEAHGPLRRASVALVVRPTPSGLEVLLIRRAEAEGDPWAGHMALPGGRRDPADRDETDTAVRETREEVGIDLARDGILLGRLDDVAPRSGAPPISVAALVFVVPGDTSIRLNHEVDQALWIPLRELLAPHAATEYLHALESGERYRFPALGYRDYVIWGLTHRILSQFIEIVRATEQVSPR